MIKVRDEMQCAKRSVYAHQPNIFGNDSLEVLSNATPGSGRLYRRLSISSIISRKSCIRRFSHIAIVFFPLKHTKSERRLSHHVRV